MKEFQSYHPIVNFTYFLAVISFSMFFMHPIPLCLSLVSGLVYSIMTGGKRALKFNLICLLPLMIITAVINPLLSHEGMTILAYLPDDNPLTMESVCYGIAAAAVIGSVICHFESFNRIMTSDKFVYLFGKAVPSLSLLLSMVLRFVPRFKRQFKVVSDAGKGIGKDISGGNIIQRAKNGIRVTSVMIGWSLENAVDTADSMKSRGYGLPNRTSYSNYSFDKRDLKALAAILVLSAYVIVGSVLGTFYFKFFPMLKAAPISAYAISVFAAYGLLLICPIIIEIWEVLRWKALK